MLQELPLHPLPTQQAALPQPPVLLLQVAPHLSHGPQGRLVEEELVFRIVRKYLTEKTREGAVLAPGVLGQGGSSGEHLRTQGAGEGAGVGGQGGLGGRAGAG